MTTAAELREALTVMTVGYLLDDDPEEVRVLIDAARTIALPLLEADPELVERIAKRLSHFDAQVPPRPMRPDHAEEDTEAYWLDYARAVLAAISTPTPGAE